MVRTVLSAGAAVLLMGLHGCHPVKPEPQFNIENISNDACLSEDPSLACSPSGTVSLAWQDCRAGPSDIWLIEKSLGGQWGQAQNLTQNTNIYNGSRFPTICYDSPGNLHAVWQQALDEGWVVFYQERAVTGAWSIPETLRIGLPTDPKLAVDLAGNVHVLLDNIAVVGFDLCHTMRRADGTWAPFVHVGNEARTVGGSEALAVTASGACFVVWSEFGLSSHDPGRVFCATRSPDGTWSDMAPVSDSSSRDCDSPALLASGDIVYLAYADFDSVHFRTYTPTTGWADLGRNFHAYGGVKFSLAQDTQGRLVAVWDDAMDTVFLARRDTTSDRVVVNDTLGGTGRTGLAVDPSGYLHLTWDHRNHASPFDVYYTGIASDKF